MANDLIAVLENGITVYAPNSEFANEKLQNYTMRIFELTQATKRNLFEIAVLLNTINDENLYKTGGFNSIQEYAEKNFGYKKSMVYKMLDVAKKFIDFRENGGYVSRLIHEDIDYSVSQLMELNQVEFDTAKSLDENGVITPEMTTKEIREVVKNFKNGEIDATGQNLSENEENDTNDNEAENSENEEIFNGDIADEMNAIIEHCENLLKISTISDNEKVAKKIDTFKKYLMRFIVNYKQSEN